MNYIDPVQYSKNIMSLMEDEMPQVDETIPVKGEKTMKERIAELTPDEKTKLKEYMDALKEIKKEIYELLHKDQVEEAGGNMSSGLTLNTEE
jgi:mevalonate kinase